MFKLLNSGTDLLYAYIDSIQKATDFIYLQTYIYSDDTYARQINQAFLQAANRGVKVYILIDAIGSLSYQWALTELLKHPNIELKFYNRLFSLRFFKHMRRLHVKSMVIDNKLAIMGGHNIHKESLSSKHDQLWLDYSLFTDYEQAVNAIYQQMLEIDNFNKSLIGLPKWYLSLKKPPRYNALVNDWSHSKHQVLDYYIKQINGAKKSVKIINAYFFPSVKVIKALSSAAKRGVEVVLVLPHKSDLTYIKLAGKTLFKHLIKSGVKIYQWQPTILHAKLALFDDNQVCIGSSNLDYLSLHFNIELNLAVKDDEFTQQVKQSIDDVISSNSNQVLVQSLYQASLIDKLMQSFSVMLINLVIFITWLVNLGKK